MTAEEAVKLRRKSANAGFGRGFRSAESATIEAITIGNVAVVNKSTCANIFRVL